MRRENFLLQVQLSVPDSYFGIRSTPVLPQQHLKDPGHSAKSTGGRLQLNILHLTYVALHDVAWLHGVHNAPRWQQFHVAPIVSVL